MPIAGTRRYSYGKTSDKIEDSESHSRKIFIAVEMLQPLLIPDLTDSERSVQVDRVVPKEPELMYE